MTASRRLSVLLSPAEIDAVPVQEGIAVVVDILRSTSVIPVGLGAGASAFVPAGSVEAARSLREATPGALLCGERSGLVPEGFDLGNSPFEYTPDRVGGRIVVFTSTNGAPLFSRLQAARQLFAGGFVNRSALVDALLQRSADVLLVAAGKDRRPALEDVAFCGSLAAGLLSRNTFVLDDGAHLARALWESWKTDVPGLLRTSAHGAWLAANGWAADLDFCARSDVIDVVPVLENGRLIALSSSG